MKPRTLGTKLFILIAAALLVGELLHSILAYQIHKSFLLERMTDATVRVSDVILRSIYHGMLENDKPSIRRTIETIGKSQDVQVVRIYNKAGTIIVSTDREEVGAQVNMAAEACDGCHVGDHLPAETLEATYARVYRDPGGVRRLGVISPIKNEPNCINNGCHAHPETNKVLGVLDVQMSLSSTDASIAREEQQLLTISVLTILFAAGLGGFFLWRTVHKPVRTLIEGTRAVSGGQLGHRIELERDDEFGQLATSFNTMLVSLQQARDRLQEWTDTLERQVSEKTQDLEKIQRQMIQIEKITSLGRLSTVVAHELNNPLASIVNYAKLSLRTLEELELPPPIRDEIGKDLRFIFDESRRLGEIVKNMLLFARRSGGVFEPIRLSEVIDKSVMLLAHQMEMQNITLQMKRQHAHDEIVGDASQLQQAFVALLINAVEAMPDGGSIVLASSDRTGEESVELRVSDTGPGIPQEHLDQIFEPFYTTKTSGKSMGLGLSVVYGILHRHRGSIQVESVEREGTTFILRLPWDQPLESEDSEAADHEEVVV